MRSKTYRNIAAKVRFFGLEVGDWGALAAVAGILSTFSSAILFNATVTGVLMWWMYKVKAKHPEGYTSSWLAHQRSPRTLSIVQEIVESVHALNLNKPVGNLLNPNKRDEFKPKKKENENGGQHDAKKRKYGEKPFISRMP